jgi:hypothetical protein
MHLGRRGIYYRKRWPAPPSSRPVESRPLTLPEPLQPFALPPAETHGVIGWTWVLVAAVLFVWVA